MKNKTMHVLVFVLSCIGFGSGLIGCGSHKKEASDKVVIWHWMTDRDAAFKTLAQKYTEQTGIKIEFQNYAPSDSYQTKVRASAQTNTLPDIYGILDKKDVFAKFIASGNVLDLTPFMTADAALWQNSFFSRALAPNVFEENNACAVKPGIYGVPLDVSNIQMLYNKKLFVQAGLDPQKPPKTWDDFLKTIAVLNKNGIKGLVSGWGEIWMIDCFANNYAFNILGEQKVLDTFRGRVKYTDPDWIKVLSLFDVLRKEKALVSGVVTMINKDAEQMFALEQAAFAFNGSWCVNVHKSMNPELEYSAMLPPRVSDRYPMMIWGGAGSSFMVNAKSPRAEQAVKFLMWLTGKEPQAYLAATTNNLPANKESLKSISPILSEFADDMEVTTHPSIWLLDEKPLVKEAFDKGIQAIIIGEKTPERVAEEVQRIKERVLSVQ